MTDNHSPHLSCEGLTKVFGGVRAVDRVAITVEAGELHSLIGPNGAGKTSLVNLLTCMIRPDEGTVRCFGEEVTHKSASALARTGVRRTFQHPRLLEDMTVAENIALGFQAAPSSKARKAKGLGPKVSPHTDELERVCALVGIRGWIDMPVKHLSGGMRKLVELARALVGDPSVLIADEPFAGVAEREVTTIAATLTRLRDDLGLTVLLVEHNLGLVFSISDRVTVMHEGRVLESGRASQIESSDLVRAAFFGLPVDDVPASAPPPATVETGAHCTRPKAARSGNSTGHLCATDLTICYGKVPVIQDVSLELKPSSVVGVVGTNGSGKSTLMRGLAGLAKVSAGEVALDGRRIDGRSSSDALRAGLAYVPQLRNLFSSLTVRENLHLAGMVAGLRDARIAELIDEYCEWFPMLEPHLARAAGELSGGQQQVVAVARGLMSQPTVLLLDEPSAGLSVGAVETQLIPASRMIASSGISVLLVEQRIAVAAAVCSRGYVLSDGAVAAQGGPDIFEHVWELSTSASTEATELQTLPTKGTV